MTERVSSDNPKVLLTQDFRTAILMHAIDFIVGFYSIVGGAGLKELLALRGFAGYKPD